MLAVYTEVYMKERVLPVTSFHHLFPLPAYINNIKMVPLHFFLTCLHSCIHTYALVIVGAIYYEIARLTLNILIEVTSL